jgi:hypothetical protein
MEIDVASTCTTLEPLKDLTKKKLHRPSSTEQKELECNNILTLSH